MEKIKAIILEDEFKLLEVLKIKLHKKCPEVQLVGEANSVQEAYELILKHQPDLVFLDIALVGETSFELLEKFEEIDFEIIFTTSYSEYAIQAFRVSAVDYLLKPIADEELVYAVRKVSGRIHQKKDSVNYQVLKHNLNHIGEPVTKIVIPGSEMYKFVKVEEIIRFEGWEKYTRIYLIDGSMSLSSYNVGHFSKLVEGFNFFQTHKSHVINITHVEGYLPEGSVVMSNGDHVPVSRRKKDSFLNNFIR